MPSGSWEDDRADKLYSNFVMRTISELGIQGSITIPLSAMNLTWFAKLAITTEFLGRLGELQLVGGTFGFTFANVTGFSVLNGLCSAMEPMCGQAYQAKSHRLLHKTLFMAIVLLILASLPISFLWFNVDKIMIHFGQQPDIYIVASNYWPYLLPDLAITLFLCQLKAYLSSQGNTLPILLCSAMACACHVPINLLLVRARGLVGVSMAIWINDLISTVLLGLYIIIVVWRKGNWDWWLSDSVRMLKVCSPCCLMTCLEWRSREILVLITWRLPNPKQALGMLTIVLNFDYLLCSVRLSVSTCASVPIYNGLGANRPDLYRRAANVSLTASLLSGLAGAAVMVASRGSLGRLNSHNRETITSAKRTMLLMAALEVVNFPVAVCRGIVHGTARPRLAMYANDGGVLPGGDVVGSGVGQG